MRFESQKGVLQQRIDVIETLQKNRTGGQDLLQMVANTVVHVDALWLTSLNRTGNSIDMQGEAGSINAVANFITQLKRRGYFDNVEIKTATENDIVPSRGQTYGFSMTAAISQHHRCPRRSRPARLQPRRSRPREGGANHGDQFSGLAVAAAGSVLRRPSLSR